MNQRNRLGALGRSTIRAVAALAIVMLLSSSADATVLRALTFDELIQDADVVVHGIVLSVQSRIVLEDDAARPYTFTTIEVRDWMKGSSKSTKIVLQENGGVWVGDTRAQIDGMPAYTMGSEVIVFAERADHIRSDRYRTLGMVQGAFRVARPKSAPAEVGRDLRDVTMAHWGADGKMKLVAGALEPAMSLSSFRLRVQRALTNRGSVVHP